MSIIKGMIVICSNIDIPFMDLLRLIQVLFIETAFGIIGIIIFYVFVNLLINYVKIKVNQ